MDTKEHCCDCHEHHHEHGGCHCHEHHHEHHHHEEGGVKKSLIKIGLAAVLLIVAVVIEHTYSLPTWQLLLVYLVPYFIVGYETLHEAVENICHGEVFDENFLMCVATIGALAIGFLPGAEAQFPEAVFVMLFFQVGEMFEGIAEGNSRKSISQLMDIRPDIAHVEREGKEVIVNPDDVKVGEIIVIKRGEKVPMDGVVIEGSSSLDTVALTGESVPRTINVGDDIFSGCINLSGVIRARVTKVFGESTASKILELVENADKNKSHRENFITRFAHIYTPIVVYAALAVAFIPPFFCGGTYMESLPIWLYRALTFLVVSCPCALVISVPLTFFSGIGCASKHGILVKGSVYLETLSKLTTVAFDKTGTLTKGIVTENNTVVADTIKEDSKEAITLLRDNGIKRIVMLSGDKEPVVSHVAKEVEVDEYHSELLPGDKVDIVERLLSEKNSPNEYLAFVGDGINDAPVLARADVGIAMGGLGSDAAIEAADVVLMDDKPSKIALGIKIAKHTLAIANENVYFSIGIKVAVLILAAIGLANMWLAVFADVGVCVLAVLNAMRASIYKV